MSYVSILGNFTYLLFCFYPGSSQNFESSVGPGLSRPIPRTDMRTIESQLARHQLTEQTVSAQRKAREDLLRADPWTHTLSTPRGLNESTTTSQDEFQTLDLNSSFTGSTMTQSLGLDDSFVSTDSKSTAHVAGRYGASPLLTPSGASAGKQQALLSRVRILGVPVRSGFRTEGRVATDTYVHDSEDDMCRYTLSLGGVTVALLESRPAYMYPTTTSVDESDGCGSSEGCASSMDEGGLDPGRYLQAVCSLLADGVNRRELDRKGEELAQALPSDHLL